MSMKMRSKDVEQKQHWMARMLRIFLPIFTLLLVAALIYDSRKAAVDLATGRLAEKKEARIESDIARLEEGLQAQPIQGPNDEFSLVPPAGWNMDEDGIEGYFDLTFRGPDGLELDFLASPVDYSDFGKLRRAIEKKEMDVGLHMHIAEDTFNQYPALYRSVKLETQRLYSIDFLAKGRAHHLLFAAPYELYERYLPIARRIMETYRPGPAPEKTKAGNRSEKGENNT